MARKGARKRRAHARRIAFGIANAFASVCLVVVCRNTLCDHRRSSASRATCVRAVYTRVRVCVCVWGYVCADECVRDVRCQVNAVNTLCGISA